ncbi:MAG: hypothetical protein ABJA67_06605 [Chthonomonadales bacterium]
MYELEDAIDLLDDSGYLIAQGFIYNMSKILKNDSEEFAVFASLTEAKSWDTATISDVREILLVHRDVPARVKVYALPVLLVYCLNSNCSLNMVRVLLDLLEIDGSNGLAPEVDFILRSDITETLTYLTNSLKPRDQGLSARAEGLLHQWAGANEPRNIVLNPTQRELEIALLIDSAFTDNSIEPPNSLIVPEYMHSFEGEYLTMYLSGCKWQWLRSIELMTMRSEFHVGYMEPDALIYYFPAFLKECLNDLTGYDVAESVMQIVDIVYMSTVYGEGVITPAKFTVQQRKAIVVTLNFLSSERGQEVDGLIGAWE